MPKLSPSFLWFLIPLAALAEPSAPQARPIIDAIPPARDVPWPGVITLAVDASDVQRGIYRVTETIPVSSAGPLTLLYPQWWPATHRPNGQAANLAGLTISAAGQVVPWKRDPVDVFAFHLVVPPGAKELVLRFQFVAPTLASQGRIVTTPEMLHLEWNAVSLYPAGHYVRQIKVAASATYPAGWKAATALEVAGQEGPTVRYQIVSYETLVDSPVFAGANVRVETLAPGVRLNIVADFPEQLAATEEQLQLHRNIVTQAIRLFGAQHYDHYDFLLALSGQLGSIGREHQRSSENGVDGSYFTDWAGSVADHSLLPHEYTHSWNGKYRRPADLWTPDYRTPMQGSLLWVYEGQTQFWGYVLSARAGMMSKQDTLDALAVIGAGLDTRAGRQWRPLLDTTNDPVIAQRRPKAWTSWQRAEDYYNEGLLIWLDVDTLIRERSGGARSLDDFARAFFGMNDRDWGQLTYTFDDLVQALNRIEPYDWAAFLRARVENPSDRAPLDGFTRGGYRLVYTDTPTPWFKALERERKAVDLSHSGGLVLGRDGDVAGVMWDSPAFNAGLTVGAKILAFNGRAFDAEKLKAAIKVKRSPLNLLVKSGEIFRTVELKYDGGLRYPRLERLSTAPDQLGALLAPKP